MSLLLSQIGAAPPPAMTPLRSLLGVGATLLLLVSEVIV